MGRHCVSYQIRARPPRPRGAAPPRGGSLAPGTPDEQREGRAVGRNQELGSTRAQRRAGCRRRSSHRGSRPRRGRSYASTAPYPRKGSTSLSNPSPSANAPPHARLGRRMAERIRFRRKPLAAACQPNNARPATTSYSELVGLDMADVRCERAGLVVTLAGDPGPARPPRPRPGPPLQPRGEPLPRQRRRRRRPLAARRRPAVD